MSPNIYLKTFVTPKKTVSVQSLDAHAPLEVLGSHIQDKVRKFFHGSLAIREVDSGSDNSCEQEVNALTNPYYDSERFGVHFVASPRHADMLMVTGAVSRNMKEALVRAYEATPTPKIVVAVGDDAINGGIFKGSYAVLDGVGKVIPVDFQIPGDPPSPYTILSSLLSILGVIGSHKEHSG